MPNIAGVLKDEITRLARKELKAETEKLKKASAQHRSEIAALKRQVAALEKQVAKLSPNAKAALEAPEEGTYLRFSAKGLVKLRKRLGLSAHDFGAVVGVSGQTIYNWEAEKARPRRSQLAGISAVRSMGKREIKKILEAQAAQEAPVAADA